MGVEICFKESECYHAWYSQPSWQTMGLAMCFLEYFYAGYCTWTIHNRNRCCVCSYLCVYECALMPHYNHLNISHDDFYKSIMKFIDVVNTIPDKQWNWDYLSNNPSISLQDILANHELPWNWSCISANPEITMQDVLTHPDKPWDWKLISRNPNMPRETIDFILDHPDKDWDWVSLSKNPMITMQDILTQSHLPWDWECISIRSFH